MPDNKNKKGVHDKKRIDINDPNELRYWSKTLNVTQTAIKAAVAKVGTSVAAVKKELAKK